MRTELKVYRLRASLSVQQTAKRADITASHYYKIERGDCVPTLDIAARIKTVLGIPDSDFIAAFNNT